MAHVRCGRDALRRLVGAQTSSSTASITNPILFAGQGLRYRKLEVILTTTIDKLGKAGETVKVAPGYFRNHLMPKLLAVPNIDKHAFLIREQRKLYQREEAEAVTEVSKTEDDAVQDQQKEDKMKEYQTAAKRLDNALLVLRRFIKVDSELRTPVTKEELVAEVARQLFVNIHPDNLHLPSPLESLGEYEVPLRLPREIPRPEGRLQWTLNVKIRRK
ncbi:uncharacterized protein [Elaeis guineensis]|uniref:Large ribosomal subunit protein bL9c n=1 Tax=Elaeis guineensis var. tenera TaxID=51953 RepID=A0A6I9S7A6_ELAGV|nr:uncharacterized protein LOC105054729 [Elaeis guineensis]XP_010934606.1 uncharacterized protein LOC105054729 [Elaeis guineensis]XP_010934608.1 uncharacterized protein LOC105054729 [Elaeis guineensis]XP_010934609.1 uncharacterized protein LOC105054729 [Elaeis guineensis]XP_010934610.1 uncharacterized protein LOC105054729 [Elaeis guineensis]XP_029123335.1 uncharacterized protein LOC105054729 [Elaeis guineensis]XP_029123336.1 uncharacterized protein LOC105054729 [Elaeis guineensis]